MKSGEDRELCVLDVGRLGLSFTEALNELLAMRAGVPILVGGLAAVDECRRGRVHHLVRRSESLEAFRLAVSRLLRTGAAMYLKLEY